MDDQARFGVDDLATVRQGVDASQLDALQRAAFGYFIDHSDPENGLVADTSLPDWPCSIAVVGFALSSYPVAVKRNWISRAGAAQRVLATLRFFDAAAADKSAETVCRRGFFTHFLDMKTGRRAWNSEVSFIDTAILMAGVLSASAFFDHSDPIEREIRDLAQSIYARVDWRWAQDGAGALRMGWKSGRFLPGRWTGFSEAPLLWILGLGSETHPMDAGGYQAWLASCEWLERPTGGYIYAGPLFIHLFPQAWIDLRGVGDSLTRARGIDYFENTRRAIATHRGYGGENPHGFTGYCEDLWGLTAYEGPGFRRKLRNGHCGQIRGYVARGAPFGPDDGTISPSISLACLPHAPEAAWRALRHMTTTFPALLHSHRFPESFNPSVRSAGPEGWVSSRRAGLDQGLLVMAIENHRSGLCWQLMRGSREVVRGLKAAGFQGGWLDGSAAA